MPRCIVLALVALVWACDPSSSRPPGDATGDDDRMGGTATGTWVGLRGGPPRVRTALAAALQTQASIRGIIDRAAVDLVSLEACRWRDVACFVALGERHGSRVIVVGDLATSELRYTLRVARINVELGTIIAEHQEVVAPGLPAIDLANRAIAGLTGEVAAAPTTMAARQPR